MTTAKSRSEAQQNAQRILQEPYSRILIPQETGEYSAEVLEFPGCFAQGETPAEAYASLEAAAESWLISCLERKQEIPSPLTNYETTGRFALRLPRSIYQRAAKAAAREGISLNQYIVGAVSERLGETRVTAIIEKFSKQIDVLAGYTKVLWRNQQTADNSKISTTQRIGQIEKSVTNDSLQVN